MYQLTNDPDILLCLDTGAWIPREHRDWPAEWLLTNEPAPTPPPYELHSPQHYAAIRQAAWKWMTACVQARRYDTVESCCSYANSTVARYRAEAMAMIQWRDDVNQALEALVVAPPNGIETWEQVRLMLPQPEDYEWPAEVQLPMRGAGEVAEL